MSIAILIWCYYPFIGGAEVFAQQLADYLVKKGTGVDIITFRSNKNLSAVEVMDGVTVHRIGEGNIAYLSTLLSFVRALWCLLKLDRTKRYSLIHSVGEGLPSWIGTFMKKLKRKPHLITLQGRDVARSLEENLKVKITRKLQRWSFQNANSVHVISRILYQQTERFGARNIVLIPNGVDTKMFKPLDKGESRKKLGFPADEQIVVSVSRLIARKGIQHLIKATALASKQLPKLRLLVVGDGEYRPELEKLIKELDLTDKVKITGLVAHDRVVQYLNAADIFVIPSLYEPLGIVTIEAMACGVPVIGSDVDGIPDVIEDGKNGILVPPGDAEKLSEAIVRLLQDKVTRNRFIQEGLKTVKEKFLWEMLLPRIEQEYTKILRAS